MLDVRHAVLVVVAALAVAAGARAESTVIRDTRLESLGATPALGRGFTPAISALHSICFDKLPTTAPSYDFEYTFDDFASLMTSQRRSALGTDEIDEFVRANAGAPGTDRAQTKRYAHQLLAVLTVDSYYASIDEASAELSHDALRLLAAGDAHGFFTGCGTHYIRSISRRSYFLTMFAYTSTSSARDREFEARIEQGVRQFQASDAAPGDAAAASRFSEQARAHDLRIVTRAIGLPASLEGNLLPFDLGSYKASLKQALAAAQAPDAGRVVAMEIMPWLSNTRVLVTLALGGADGDAATVNQRRRILADNAEFYIELAGALQDLSTQVHRAEACRRELDQRVLDAGGVKPAYVGATAVSHRGGARLPLARLLAAVSDASIDRMRASGLAWRGGADGKSGAGACLEELERTNLSGRYHNEIASCEWRRLQLPDAGLIEEYCPANLELAGPSP